MTLETILERYGLTGIVIPERGGKFIFDWEGERVVISYDSYGRYNKNHEPLRYRFWAGSRYDANKCISPLSGWPEKKHIQKLADIANQGITKAIICRHHSDLMELIKNHFEGNKKKFDIFFEGQRIKQSSYYSDPEVESQINIELKSKKGLGSIFADFNLLKTGKLEVKQYNPYVSSVDNIEKYVEEYLDVDSDRIEIQALYDNSNSSKLFSLYDVTISKKAEKTKGDDNYYTRNHKEWTIQMSISIPLKTTEKMLVFQSSASFSNFNVNNSNSLKEFTQKINTKIVSLHEVKNIINGFSDLLFKTPVPKSEAPLIDKHLKEKIDFFNNDKEFKKELNKIRKKIKNVTKT